MKKILEIVGVFLAIAFVVFGYFFAIAHAVTDFKIPNYAVDALFQFDSTIADDAGLVALTQNGSAAYATGIFGNAYSFNGSTNFLTNAPLIGGVNGNASDWSVGGWVKWSTTGYKIVWGSWTVTQGDVQLYLNTDCNGPVANGHVAFYTQSAFDASGTCADYTASTLNNGNWHYLVIERDGSTFRLFVDGAAAGTAAVPSNFTIGNQNLNRTIGVDSTGGSFKYDGLLDNLYYVNYQQSLAEIQTIWNGGTGERVVLFDQDTQGIANDFISFNTPSQSQIVQDTDPNLFNVGWHTGATTTQSGWTKIQIDYGTSTGGFASTTFTASTTRTWSLNEWNQTNGNGFSTFAVPRTANIIPQQRYYAQARLIWETLLPPNYTTVISTTTATTTVLFFGEASQANTADLCSGVWDCILYGFANTLFTPHDISMNAFRATYTSLQTSPPFSYLFGYVQAASDAATSTIATTTNYDVILHFPAPWNNITVLTSSSYDNFVGTSTAFTKAKFFDIQRMVIWVGAGLKLISMFII